MTFLMIRSCFSEKFGARKMRRRLHRLKGGILRRTTGAAKGSAEFLLEPGHARNCLERL